MGNESDSIPLFRNSIFNGRIIAELNPNTGDFNTALRVASINTKYASYNLFGGLERDNKDKWIFGTKHYVHNSLSVKNGRGMTHVGVKFVTDHDKKIKETGAAAAGGVWVVNKLAELGSKFIPSFGF